MLQQTSLYGHKWEAQKEELKSEQMYKWQMCVEKG